MAQKVKRDLEREITDSIIAAIESGNVAPWSRPWVTGKGSGLALRHEGTPYRGVNQFLLGFYIGIHGYTSPYWMTYAQAKTYGGQVRKGSKAQTSILWKPFDVTRDDGTVEQRFMMRANPVFNACQIDGLPDRFFPAADPDLAINKDSRDPDVDAWFDSLGMDLRHGGDSAHYAMLTDSVHMPAFERFRDALAYYSTLAHESVHWAGGTPRLAELEPAAFGSVNYAKEELVAELGSAMINAALGLASEPRPDHAAYIKSWLAAMKSDKKYIFDAASKAQKRVDFLESRAARKDPAAENAA